MNLPLTKLEFKIMNYKNFLLFFALSFGITALVHADSDLTNRMKARLPDVLAAKSDGAIGESTEGKLLIRTKNPTSELEKLVKLENKDRSELFKLLAKKTGGDPGDVAKKFAKGLASKAKSGHWFKNSSGSWVSK